LPVTRDWTCAELILIVPEVVIGPPVRPDPVATLVTVPPLVVFTWHTTEPSALMTRIEDPAALVEHARYSITWSARPSSDGGIVSPSAFAVLRLITSSNLVGCSTGRSAGFVPLRILST
jgi:hypothetical protein